MERFGVQADAQLDDDNVMLTLSGPSWLFNVNASPAEWAQGLPRVHAADPSRRLEVNLGTSAGRPVWWTLDSGQLMVVVGHDTESWDFVVTLPPDVLVEIESAVSGAESDWG